MWDMAIDVSENILRRFKSSDKYVFLLSRINRCKIYECDAIGRQLIAISLNSGLQKCLNPNLNLMQINYFTLALLQNRTDYTT